MADDPLNEDQWLYGESNDGPEPGAEAEQNTLEGNNHEDINREVPEENDQPVPPGESEENDDGQEKPEQAEGEEGLRPPGEELEEGEDDDDSDDSDDNVQVTIGDIKATAQYGNLNIKRNAMLSTGIEKHKQAGKFSIDEFESIGTINGVAAHEYSIDALEEKPWRKPGADITDYFNYGFNEDTWRAYCERQKSMRVHESGAGLGGLGVARTSGSNVTLTDPKYGMVSSVANAVRSKAGPPPGPRRAGVIDVIGTTVASRRTTDSPPKENNVQVMTADKRDYGRKTGYDMSVPPPFVENPGPMPPGYNPAYPPGEFYPPEMDPYYQQYDRPPPNIWPTQDKPPTKEIMLPEGVVIKQEPPDKPPKERQSERDRDRHKDRHRHRSRSRSAERRSRKHKSRSRSPSHRSHKKKKSKKSERERSRTRDDRDRSRTRDDRDRSRTRDTRDRSRSRGDERDRSRTRDDRERSRDRDREASQD